MDAMAFFLSAAAVFVLLCLSEIGWRRGYMTSEVGRKFVHITVGSFVAFWPFFLTWNQIRLLSLAFIVAVILSKTFNIFSAIHSVQRPTYGEFFFAVVVGLLTFITHSKAIYAAALLQMSVADGMAAIVGVEYGIKQQRWQYHVFGHAKTVIGTTTFFLISAAILFGYSADTMRLAWYYVPLIAAGATMIENIGINGLDNLLAPLFVAFVLTQLA
jgi:dolichol kinase